MKYLSIEQLKESPQIIKDIRWDVTPQIFVDPKASPDGEPVDISYGYMLYVDLLNDQPALLVMQLKEVVSKTVGHVSGIPDEFLREAMQCTDRECVAGMYPLGEKFETWLKKELGVS